MRKIIILLYILTLPLSIKAQLRLPSLFASNMVIQQNANIPIWGWARPTQDIIIKVSWDTTTIKAKTQNTALWKASIKTPPAGGPHTITVIADHDKKLLENVMSGEVWLCSGQSNMEWSMDGSADGKPILNQINDPNIRLFQVPRSASSSLQIRGEGEWNKCNGQTAGGFSAVAYFFGKKLYNELKIPIGLIHASWGGTTAEVWVPKEYIEEDSLLKAYVGKKGEEPWGPSKLGTAYNSMIAPLVPVKLAGIIWYQGESNVDFPSHYKQLMEKLILSWRKVFMQDLPFYYVQIAPFNGYGDNQNGVLLREQQLKVLDVPKTGMVVISDVVENINEIHPRYKKPVGERLARLALEDTYQKKGLNAKFPSYKEMKIEKDKILLTFENAPNGLTTKTGDAPSEFMIAGADKNFYPAKAKIENNEVILYSNKVKVPVAVRYAWKNEAVPSLYSKEGLPVPSFRTDNWPVK